MRPLCHPHGLDFDIFISAKSNDITKNFVKFILVQKIALTTMWACSKIMKLFTLWHPMHTFA